MKDIMILLLMCSLILSDTVYSQTKEDENKNYGTLIIIITGLENNNGEVQMGLFNSSESYKGKKPKYRGAIMKVLNQKVEWKLDNIPFGDYAVKAFHDENSNNEINTNFLGIPTEKYGFSNNARSIFGLPSFDDAKFKFNKIEMTAEIILK